MDKILNHNHLNHKYLEFKIHKLLYQKHKVEVLHQQNKINYNKYNNKHQQKIFKEKIMNNKQKNYNKQKLLIQKDIFLIIIIYKQIKNNKILQIKIQFKLHGIMKK